MGWGGSAWISIRWFYWNCQWNIYENYSSFHGDEKSRLWKMSDLSHKFVTFHWTTVDSEIPRPTTWMVLKPVVNNGINHQPQLVSRISEPSTVWLSFVCLSWFFYGSFHGNGSIYTPHMEYVALKPMIFVDLEVFGGSKFHSGISVGTWRIIPAIVSS